jgi:hypothetical protein
VPVRMDFFAGGSTHSLWEQLVLNEPYVGANKRAVATYCSLKDATFSRSLRSHSWSGRTGLQGVPDGEHDPSSESSGPLSVTAPPGEAVPERTPLGSASRPCTTAGLASHGNEQPHRIGGPRGLLHVPLTVVTVMLLARRLRDRAGGESELELDGVSLVGEFAESWRSRTRRDRRSTATPVPPAGGTATSNPRRRTNHRH